MLCGCLSFCDYLSFRLLGLARGVKVFAITCFFLRFGSLCPDAVITTLCCSHPGIYRIGSCTLILIGLCKLLVKLIVRCLYWTLNRMPERMCRQTVR